MNTATKTALLCLLVAGCAVPLSDDLDLNTFAKSPDVVNVAGSAQSVTCDMTIVPSGGRTVKYAACNFKSPSGRRAGCLATNHVANVWSCDVTIPANTEDNTWTLDYVFAEDDLGAKLFATGAELVADVPNVMPTAGEVDLDVQSAAQDTTPPEITDFTVLPASIDPGGTVTCTIFATDSQGAFKDSGCTFLPDDSSPSVSCISHGGLTCTITIPAEADAGVTYTEVNHFARDESLNVTVGDLSRTFNTSPANLLVHYEFDSDCTTDSSGNARTGTCTNGAAWTGAEGRPSAGAVSLDGVDDYVLVGGAETVYDLPNGFSVLTWVKANSSQTGGWNAVAAKGDPGLGGGFSMARDSSGPGTEALVDKGGLNSSINSTSVWDDTWHHVAMTYDGTTLIQYVDAVAGPGASVTAPIDLNDQPLWIGGFSNFGSGYLTAIVDDFRVYNEALSQVVIQSIFDTGCTPDTCVGLGYDCGAPPDGCGGPPLSCGTCTGDDTCIDFVCTPSGQLTVDVSGLNPSCVGTVDWSISPGDYSGTGSWGPTVVPDDTYTITWGDSIYECVPPSTEQVVVAADSQTFDLVTTDYAVRVSRSATVDVGLDDGGAPPLAGAPPGGGAWSAASDSPWGGEYSDSGTGDGSLAATLYDGRDYTVTFTPEVGYITPNPVTVTAQATPQVAPGDYLTAGSGVDKDFYATRTSCRRPCAVQFDAQFTEPLTWAEVRDGEFVWDFDDGGSTADSEGFLAANVFETAGTYTVTLTVDGEAWNTQNVVVSDPTAVACVSPTSDFTNCPGGASTYTSLSAAVTGIGTTNTHILLHGGESFTVGNYTGSSNFTIGAYDNGTSNPDVTMNGVWLPGTAQSLVDLDIDHTSHNNSQFEGNGAKESPLVLRVTSVGNAEVLGRSDVGGGFFFIDSYGENQGDQYGVYAARPPNYTSQRLVFKGSTVFRNHCNPSGGGTYWVFRTQQIDHMLVQNSELLVGPVGQECDYGSLTIRGNTNWHLIQGNYFNSATETKPQSTNFDETIANVVWERNVHDNRTSAHPWGMEIVANSSVFRNNLMLEARGGVAWRVEDYTPNSFDIEIYNNTTHTTSSLTVMKDDAAATSITFRNNIVYSTNGGTNCRSGNGTFSNNWCYLPNNSSQCETPNGATGAAACNETSENPQFIELLCGRSGEPACSDTDVGRPAAGVVGIDAGNNTVPVWIDLHGADRNDGNLDVGAVER